MPPRLPLHLRLKPKRRSLSLTALRSAAKSSKNGSGITDGARSETADQRIRCSIFDAVLCPPSEQHRSREPKQPQCSPGQHGPIHTLAQEVGSADEQRGKSSPGRFSMPWPTGFCQCPTKPTKGVPTKLTCTCRQISERSSVTVQNSGNRPFVVSDGVGAKNLIRSP
jgi:hypothetical protein